MRPVLRIYRGDVCACLLLFMSHLLVMHRSNHTCLVPNLVSVLVFKRLVSVVVKFIVKDLLVIPLCKHHLSRYQFLKDWSEE